MDLLAAWLDMENLFQAIHKTQLLQTNVIMYNKLYEVCNEKMRETCFRTQRINVNYLRRKDWVKWILVFAAELA